MHAATLCFLGMAGFIVAILALVSMRRSPQRNGGAQRWEARPTWNEDASWDEIKAAWIKWYAQVPEMGAPRQQSLLSWGRTLALCAGLCLLGILLEVEFGSPISVQNILAEYLPSYSERAVSQPSPSRSHQGQRQVHPRQPGER